MYKVMGGNAFSYSHCFYINTQSKKKCQLGHFKASST